MAFFGRFCWVHVLSNTRTFRLIYCCTNVCRPEVPVALLSHFFFIPDLKTMNKLETFQGKLFCQKRNWFPCLRCFEVLSEIRHLEKYFAKRCSWRPVDSCWVRAGSSWGREMHLPCPVEPSTGSLFFARQWWNMPVSCTRKLQAIMHISRVIAVYFAWPELKFNGSGNCNFTVKRISRNFQLRAPHRNECNWTERWTLF